MNFKRIFCIVSLAALLWGCKFSNNKSLPPTTPRVHEGAFPVSVQFSPVPSGKGWKDEVPPLTEQTMQETVHNFILHGCTHLDVGEFSEVGGLNEAVMEYATRLGMKIDFTSNGVQMFGRNAPPEFCIYSPEYMENVRKKIEPVLGRAKKHPAPATIFPYMDEPFHIDTTAFDYRDPVRQEFQKCYGYEMPRSYAEARKDARKHLDFINFHASTFTHAWKQIYQEVKTFDPRPLVVMTHDSHNVLGGGVQSDSKYAIDDVFHWGGEFADMFLWDIYPYNYFDYRYGEFSLIRKPRMSQMHYTMAQMRNLAVTYGKKLGFWLGTYNEGWFRRYLNEEMRQQYWMERELSYTAIAGGVDFLITGLHIPQDARHWDDFGKAMRTVQKAGAEILNAPKPKAKAAFLFPRTQHIQYNEEYFNVGVTFELCLRAFGELDIIHESQITDATVNGYPILVLADVKMLPEKVAAHIEKFVENGGIVIADCVPQANEVFEPLETMKKLFGVSAASTNRAEQKGTWNPFSMIPARWAFDVEPVLGPNKKFADVSGKVFDEQYDFRLVTPRNCVPSNGTVALKMKSGQPALITKQTGKGKTYLLGFCLQDAYFETWKDNDVKSREGLYALMHGIFADTGLHPRAYSSNPDMEVAVRYNDKEVFVFVINHEAPNAITEVTLRDLPFEVDKITDVEWGRKTRLEWTTVNGVTKFVIMAVEGTPTGVTRLLRLAPKQL